jgi:hypothetical protein
MSSTQHSTDGDVPLYRVRERQWIYYLGPTAAAPLAHILVRPYIAPPRRGNTSTGCWMGGIIGSTVRAVGMRLALMPHAGYPAGRGMNPRVREREQWVTGQERKNLEEPNAVEIAKGVAWGFG